jgi:hypothetical protein
MSSRNTAINKKKNRQLKYLESSWKSFPNKSLRDDKTLKGENSI